MAIEDAFVLGRELSRIARDAAPADRQRRELPIALKRYNKNRVLRAAAVQGMSRLSSAILFQYNHPVDLKWEGGLPRLENTAPKSIITRMGQGFLQNFAFPLQFEFLFDFPGAHRRRPPPPRPPPRPPRPPPSSPSHPRSPHPTGRGRLLQGEVGRRRRQFSPLGRAVMARSSGWARSRNGSDGGSALKAMMVWVGRRHPARRRPGGAAAML